MDRELVNSSMIASIKYDRDSGTVEVEFRSNGQVWQYYDVPQTMYDELRTAQSLGKAFNALIKNTFRAIRVG